MNPPAVETWAVHLVTERIYSGTTYVLNTLMALYEGPANFKVIQAHVVEAANGGPYGPLRKVLATLEARA